MRDLKLRTKFMDNHEQLHHDCNVDGQPVSPVGQFVNNSALSLCVHAIFEFEQPWTDVSHIWEAIKNILLPQNARFSCIMAEDEEGVLRWEKTEVNMDDHLIFAQFPPDQNEYDEFVNDYISSLHLKPLPQSRPLWQFHILNYNTRNVASTVIIRFHHSLGDGISLMSLMFACVRRADNPTLNLTFPSSKPVQMPARSFSIHGLCYHLCKFVLILWYTLTDLITSLLRSKWIEDTRLPFRGPDYGVEFLPKVFSATTLNLDDILEIKNSIGGTVNDVITGVIFYGFQRYLQSFLSGEKQYVEQSNDILTKMKSLRVTALALVNTRALSGLQNLEEMMKTNTQMPWGNHFGFLHVPIPVGKFENPLDFVRRAKRSLNRKKMSLEVFVTGRLLCYLAKFKGAKASAKYVYNTLANSTLVISHLIGPSEKMAMEGNPVKSFFFWVTGSPNTLVVTIVSYMGSVRVQVMGAKGYIDADILSTCFREAFEEIKHEATNSIRGRSA
eukprot:Gb_13461 [translate_table: standard]